MNNTALKFNQLYDALKTPYEKILILQKYAKFRISKHEGEKELREKFSNDSNSKALMKQSKCAVCNDPAEHRHHVIQLQNGGLNLKDNIKNLCQACHALVHPWMNLTFKSKKEIKRLKKLSKPRLKIVKNPKKEKPVVMITVTKDILELGRCEYGSWNKKQIQQFVVVSNGNSWEYNVIGRQFPKNKVERFLFLKNKHLKKKGKI